MIKNLLDINKTKYRYLMDNIELKGTAITYTIPVDKEPKEINGELNRNYPFVKISYKKLVKMINKTAEALVALGLKKGDIVVICSTNTPETVYFDYALNKLGAIPSYIYPNITKEEILYFINEVEAKYIFTVDEPNILKNVLDAIENTKIEKVIVSPIIQSFPFIFKKIANYQANIVNNRVLMWDELLSYNGVKVHENEFISNEICDLMHTSGTTSLPKAVMQSNENINATSKNYYKENMIWEKGKIYLQVLPIFVAFGNAVFHIMFSSNINVVMIPEMNPKNFSGLVNKFKPNYVTATPLHWASLIESGLFDNKKLDYFEVIGSGGDGFGSIQKRVESFLEEHNCSLHINDGYGSTEVSAIAVSNTNTHYKCETLGKPVGDVEVGIFDEDTLERLGFNEIGEIAISGDTVTLGYYNDELTTKLVFVKHNDNKTWVHMGDLGKFDEDGFLHYEGRIKNVIARKSFKFSPKEIEDAIMLCSDVKQCIVFGKYDAEEGQVPSAHIVLNDCSDIEESVNKIIDFVNNNVQEFHRPTVYKIKDSIINTRNNKININALKIEDIATIINGVNDAEISLSTDNEYDYDLKIYVDFDIDEKKAIDLIEKTAKDEKVLNGKIKYIFYTKKGKNYYRYAE